MLGGKSPLAENTLMQVKELQSFFSSKHGKDSFKVFMAMRYWHPFFADIFSDILDYAPQKILFIPLYPQFSSTTTLSFYEEAKKVLKKKKSKIPIQLLCCYPTDTGFIEGLIQEVYKGKDIYLKNKTKTRLLLTAHGLPISVIKKGDPYLQQLKLTQEALKMTLGNFFFDEIILCFQSKVGFLPWLEPSLEKELIRASKDRVSVVLLPISFVSEHLETLFELDYQYKNLARNLNIPGYLRLKTVSCSPFYIEGLYKLILSVLSSQKSVVSQNEKRLCSSNKIFCPCSLE